MIVQGYFMLSIGPNLFSPSFQSMIVVYTVEKDEAQTSVPFWRWTAGSVQSSIRQMGMAQKHNQNFEANTKIRS